MKLFTSAINNFLLKARVLVPGKPFQPSLMSANKARCFTRVGSGLNQKHYTRLERLNRDKHSSLLRTLVNYGRKSCITLGSGFTPPPSPSTEKKRNRSCQRYVLRFNHNGKGSIIPFAEPANSESINCRSAARPSRRTRRRSPSSPSGRPKFETWFQLHKTFLSVIYGFS